MSYGILSGALGVYSTFFTGTVIISHTDAYASRNFTFYHFLPDYAVISMVSTETSNIHLMLLNNSTIGKFENVKIRGKITWAMSRVLDRL